MENEKGRTKEVMTEKEKIIKKFNTINPIGTRVKYKSKVGSSICVFSIVGSAREYKGNVVVQLSGVNNLIQIDSIDIVK